MPLTEKEVAELEAAQSKYGCGADGCKACYPIQYSCAWCLEEFEAPIANGEMFECEECGWVNNADYVS